MWGRTIRATRKKCLDPVFEKMDHGPPDLCAMGFSLIEVLIIVAIVGILSGLAAVSFVGMSRKTSVDDQIKRVQSDLTTAKVMAMAKGRKHFVTLNASSYTVYDDSSPAPDGDDQLTIGADSVVLRSDQDPNISTFGNSQRFLPIAWNGAAPIAFNSRGLCSTGSTTICIFSDATPRYDCVNVSQTGIALGKLATRGVCSAANCKMQ